MTPGGTLLLSRDDVAGLIDLDECIDAVAAAFRDLAEGRAAPPRTLDLTTDGGGFHVKAASLRRGRLFVAVKTNGNFPGNPSGLGLPTIQGTIALCDGEDGRTLALLDSTEITALRTGAATAVAARHLARADSSVAAICGCGTQGRIQFRALTRVLPLARAVVWDADPAAAARYADEMTAALEIDVRPVDEPGRALAQSDVAVTCTPATRPFIKPRDLRPGMFLSAVGADAESKRELEPGALAGARIVVDTLEQCARIGELHHALEERAVRREDVHAELGEIVAGRRPGRRAANETFVFDSTGIAIQDVATAAIVYERAVERGIGMRFDFVERAPYLP